MMDSSFGTSVFRCPSGLNNRGDLTGIALPASSTDSMGALFTRLVSKSTGIRVDNWYGINGWTATTTQNTTYATNAYLRWPFTETPGVIAGFVEPVHKLTDFQNPSELVLIFDGIYWAQQQGAYVNARHENITRTNLLMADMHTRTIVTASLPSSIKTYQNGFRFILTPNGP
jgi:sulfur transfer complex TusBCD TusB component (DsrH family)